MKRRDAIKTVSVAAGLPFLAPAHYTAAKEKLPSPTDKFMYSLNTSTVSGHKPGVGRYIDIAARAGYDCIELWISDIRAYISSGKSLNALKKLSDDSKLPIVNAIGFATWMTDDEEKRKAGFAQMREEMDIMAALGCPRIAAPAAGITTPPDLLRVGERYKELLNLGRQTGVMPQLEFWGPSLFYHLGQAMMAAAVANDTEVHILADIFHLYRGNSGFDCLKMLDGGVIDIFHMNDYPGAIPREQLQDKDRVFPGDGAAPLGQILSHLYRMSGPKILSLELFNRNYWDLDPLLVAKTGLEKMKKAVGDLNR
jgi:2-keto-myo-inositol isomerase